VGPKAGLDAKEKRKILPLPKIETRPVAISTELPRLSKVSHIELKKKAVSTDLGADTVIERRKGSPHKRSFLLCQESLTVFTPPAVDNLTANQGSLFFLDVRQHRRVCLFCWPFRNEDCCSLNILAGC
jgi:hypothetical protein